MNDKKIIDGNWHGLEGRWGVGIESWNSRIKENLISESCADMSREPLLEPNRKFLGFLKAWVASSSGLSRNGLWREVRQMCDFFFFFCFHRHWLGREGQSYSTQYVGERGEIWIYVYFWSLGSWLFENVGYLSAWGFQTTSSSAIFLCVWPAPNNHHLSNSLIEIKIIKTYCTLGIYCNLLISEENDTANYILFITLVFYKVMKRIGL